MSEPVERHPVTTKRVVFDHPGTRGVACRRGVVWSTEDGGKTLDIYRPPGQSEAESGPAVIFVSGLSDIGAKRVLGCRINEMESFVSWARLVAASGLIGVTYTTGADPAVDTRALSRHLRTHGLAYGIDADRVGLWACSSHVPNALGLLMDRQFEFRCAALCYGYMLDLDGTNGVAEAQRTWRFVNPSADRSVADLPADTPLLIVRAGQDATPHVNDSIDRFLAHALRQNLAVSLVNHHTGPHAFDLDDHSRASRETIMQILTFLQSRLEADRSPARP